ncbi:VWA domain-containing protein [Salinarimonas rosea]|uniref:VWA domain-containing protein n=1 Tax=Salinarimonas rosea TaxID=552063 RepID=UPI00146FB782|nr:VWA domain-containing protein [Salinarimonas rosea]
MREAIASRGGNVTLAFALVMVPILGLIGAAVDYTRARNAADRIQLALDNAALAAVRDPDATSKETLLTFARQQLETVLGPDASLTIAELDGDKVDETVWLRARVRVGTTFMRVVNVDDVSVSRYSEASYGRKSIDIALVMDNTGSMGSRSKMTELKRALCGDTSCTNANPTSGFMHIMREAASGPDRIRVGLVPFDIGVRVPQAVQDTVRTERPLTSRVTVPPRGSGYCAVPRGPVDVQRVSWLRFAAADADPVVTDCSRWGRTTPATWDGCVWDRDQIPDDLDVTDADVDLDDPRTLFPAVNCPNTRLARMAPLADVWTQNAGIISSLRQMEPSGNTNVTIGAAWGMAMLTERAPFVEAGTITGDEVERFMILLTDGDNTQSKFSRNRSEMDPRTQAACDSAKDAGIVVVTVRVINGNRDLLRRCATSPDLYYEVSRASDLKQVFDEIARRIGSIRLTQ